MSTTSPVAGRRSGSRRPFRWKVLLALGATLLGLCLVEAAVRVRHYLKHGSFGSIYQDVVDPRSGLRIPAPGQTGRIATDSRGFRSPELEVPKPEGRVRVAFLGGSTTYCAEASGNEATWPHLVVEALRAALPDRRFDYLNAGGTGYATEHSLKNLRHRVASLEPDVLVVYHATNDLVVDSRAAAVEQGIYEVDRESVLERWSMTWSLIKKNFLLRDRGSDAATDGPVLRFDPDALARRFEKRLTELTLACQAVAPVVALVTFSHRVRPEQDAAARRDACQSARYYMPYLTPDGILESIAAYNRAIRRVAAATGALLVGGEHDIPADGEHFNDSVHFRDAGCRKMAERVSGALVDGGALARLPR